MAKFVEEEVLKKVDKWEKNWDVPKSAYAAAYRHGVYAARYPDQYGTLRAFGYLWLVRHAFTVFFL